MSEDLRSYADKQTEQRVLEEIGGGIPSDGGIVVINYNSETKLIDKSFNEIRQMLSNGQIPVFYSSITYDGLTEDNLNLIYYVNIEIVSDEQTIYGAYGSGLSLSSNDPDAPMKSG